MFHVFEYSVFYPCCKYEIREGTPSSLTPFPCVWRGRISLHGKLGAYKETVGKVTFRTLPRSVLRQQAVIEGGASSKFF